MEPLPGQLRLACREGTFPARAKVPLELSSAVALSSEVGWSLKTEDHREALEKVRQASYNDTTDGTNRKLLSNMGR